MHTREALAAVVDKILAGYHAWLPTAPDNPRCPWTEVNLNSSRRNGSATQETNGRSQQALHKSFLTKTEADDLLDWLEMNGFQDQKLILEIDGYFTVRWLVIHTADS